MTPRVVLASASPRRRELLGALIDDFSVAVSGVEEPLDGDAVENARSLAVAKARDVAMRDPGSVVVGSDTIVFDGERSYAKPDDAAEAMEMWRRLGGREHSVVTAVAVIANNRVGVSEAVARVELAALSNDQLREYIASGRPMDKAGAYAIQDEDVPTVARLDGCYCAVMGLPLWTVKELLEQEGVTCRPPSATLPRCASCPERPRQPD